MAPTSGQEGAKTGLQSVRGVRRRILVPVIHIHQQQQHNQRECWTAIGDGLHWCKVPASSYVDNYCTYVTCSQCLAGRSSHVYLKGHDATENVSLELQEFEVGLSLCGVFSCLTCVSASNTHILEITFKNERGELSRERLGSSTDSTGHWERADKARLTLNCYS